MSSSDLKNGGMIWVSALNAGRTRQENTRLALEQGVYLDRKKIAWPELLPHNKYAQSLRRRGRLIDPVKETLNKIMLKKYTKYAATAFAVASLSTFMIGCGGDGLSDAELEGPSDPNIGTEDEGGDEEAEEAEEGGE